MAEKRKLLAEIEKCFKKIDEGVELFEETMSKMQDANSDNQRDKYQDDLKKEIKKLQRLRDQVKGWQNSSEIKDKDKLTQYRKIIEGKMEQFKDVERENKTKPHSKQGLCAEEKLDPREREKVDTTEWLQGQISELEVEVDRTETQIEQLSTADTGKKRGKNKDDPKKGEKEKKTEDLRKHHERMKFHISKLEVCMRLVTNETLESKDVMDTLKESMEMFIQSLDPDYDGENGPSESLDPEDLYEELDLSSYMTTLGGVVHVSSTDHEHEHKNDNGSHHPYENGHSHEEDHVPKSRHGSADTPASPAPKRTIISQPATPLKVPSQLSAESVSASVSSPPPATPPPIQGIPYNSVAAGVKPTAVPSTPQSASKTTTSTTNITVAANSSKPSTNSPAHNITVVTTTTSHSPAPAPSTPKEESRSPLPTPSVPSTPIAAVAAPSPVVSTPTTTINSPAPSSTTATTAPNKSNEVDPPASTELNAPMTVADCSPNVNEHCDDDQQHSDFQFSNGPQSQEVATLKAMAADAVPVSANINEEAKNTSIDPIGTPQKRPTSGLDMTSLANSTEDTLRQVLRLSALSNEPTSNKPQSAHIPAWLGASPLGRTPHSSDHDTQLAALDQALARCPPYMDSERPRSYLPKMPCSTASYYPQSPPPNADTLEYYLRLSPETLFFTFYYMEGSRAQLLAAKALKKLSWRFHTKYLMWFQRHEEPKQITDDFEQGTYIYFDYEKWSQRKKEQFVFEYRFLEDKDYD